MSGSSRAPSWSVRIGAVACASGLLFGLVGCRGHIEGEASSEKCGGAGAKAAVACDVDLSRITVRAVPVGNGVAQRTATASGVPEPLPSTYRETELLVGGTAAIYSGPATGPAHVDSADHPFVTRVLVRAPRTTKAFSGTVWVEPFNTSGGPDADAVWSMIAPLVEDRGDAWVGVSVRAGSARNLKQFDAVRYADVSFDSNAYAWDALRTVGSELKRDGSTKLLPGTSVKRVYMAGYSQSAVDVATAAAAFNRTTRLANGKPVYDGYFLGAHDGNLTPLGSAASIIPMPEVAPIPAIDVPVVDFEPQTDVEGFAIEVSTELLRKAGVSGIESVTTPTYTYIDSGSAYVRRPNRNATTDRFALFEVPGAPHVTGGGGAGSGCDGSSSFPTKYFARAAAANLASWAQSGHAPVSAPRIELAKLDKVSVAADDATGNAIGGVRSPYLDVPLSRFEAHSGGGPTCKQVGKETLFSPDVLRQRYGDVTAYMKKFTAGLDRAIKAGALLERDRAALIDAQRAHAREAFAAPPK